MIEVSKTKAYSVQGINVNGVDMISLRQMYKTKDDPSWKPGKQGITINISAFLDIVVAARTILEEGEFETLEFDKS